MTSNYALTSTCSDALRKTPATDNDYALAPLINRGLRTSITEWLQWHFGQTVPVIPLSELELDLVDSSLQPDHNGDHIGGDSTSFRSVYRGTPVHVKQIPHRDKAEVKLVYEMSRRNLSPQILGITEFKNGKNIGIVSELVDAVAFIKTLYHFGQDSTFRIVTPTLRVALKRCPDCKSNWSENLKLISEFLYQNKVSVLDPQLMLLADGRVLLYDFGLYEIGDSDASMVKATRLQFQYIQQALERI
jgi:hypothetical protein